MPRFALLLLLAVAACGGGAAPGEPERSYSRESMAAKNRAKVGSCAEMLLARNVKDAVEVRPLRIDPEEWNVRRITLPSGSRVIAACEKVALKAPVSGPRALIRIDTDVDPLTYYQGQAEALGYDWAFPYVHGRPGEISVYPLGSYKNRETMAWRHGEPFVTAKKATDGSVIILYHD